jgi:5S rRNA maturation endonuclease (ribonuclease M5)
MEKTTEGDWTVFREKTRKSFERFRIDATRGLMSGLPGLVTKFEWKGLVCDIRSLGAESTLEFDHGEIVCKIRISPWIFGFPRDKILSDIENVTREVAGLASSDNRDVFIVHGHDMLRTRELERLIRSLGLRPIVLQDQDDRGMTIVEKFEYYASACSFAFVLMTPDDRIEAGGDIESRFRARQNVIMELGWFMAHLGRQRVVLLHKGEVEIPSDISGVVYIRFDDSVYDAEHRISQRLKGVGLIE